MKHQVSHANDRVIAYSWSSSIYHFKKIYMVTFLESLGRFSCDKGLTHSQGEKLLCMFLQKVLYTFLSASRNQEIKVNICRMTDCLKKEQFRRSLV